MKNLPLLASALLLAALTAFAGGCGSEEEPPPAGTPDGGSLVTPPPGGCSLLGVWHINGANGPTIEIKANGTDHLAYPGGAGGQDGTWAASGGTLSITDATCGSAVGQYSFSFASACQTINVALVQDPCASRGQAINGSVLTR